jgi:hypothetical protein
MPDSIEYGEAKRRLLLGSGYVEGVAPEVWNYEVSGKQVLRQWFSYRKANRERLIIGDRRPPSKLGDIQPDHWLAEYTAELIHVLNVIGLLVGLEPAQAELLEQVCASQTIGVERAGVQFNNFVFVKEVKTLPTTGLRHCITRTGTFSQSPEQTPPALEDSISSSADQLCPFRLSDRAHDERPVNHR